MENEDDTLIIEREYIDILESWLKEESREESDLWDLWVIELNDVPQQPDLHNDFS